VVSLNTIPMIRKSCVSMHIWPAIDIRGGKCVRLAQGDYQRETVFGNDPLEMAQHWVGQGAQRLHLVDLDGARDGRPVNVEVVKRICAAVSVPCQLGGGIRDERTIEKWLTVGVSRLVLGTAALKHPDWFRQMIERYPQRLALGIDARDGMVATEGWLETSSMPATELAQQFDGLPLAAIIYTDIAKDGMLAGPNLAEMGRMKQWAASPVIASGGVTSTGDLVALAELELDGCIIGRALYEGNLSLPDALAATATA